MPVQHFFERCDKCQCGARRLQQQQLSLQTFVSFCRALEKISVTTTFALQWMATVSSDRQTHWLYLLLVGRFFSPSVTVAHRLATQSRSPQCTHTHTHTHTGFLFFFFVVATTKCKFWPWYGVGHLVWWWWWPHLPKVGAKGESTEKDSQRPRPLRSLLRLWSKHSDDAANAVLGHSISSITYQS